MDNNSLSFLFFLFLVGIAAIGAIPYWRICSRTGLSKGLIAVLFIPFFGWAVFAWIVAFSDWPLDPSVQRPRKGMVYTPGEIEEFKRRGMM